ncbi:hypothetical protein PINS_up002972 [Pythium insidiosum]|nr:hypothetical protein PINS_up002972 [Pythium insidiosum]
MPRIVIIGAGPAGLNLFQALAKQLSPADDTEVVVFEKSKYYYHAVGTPRAYTEEAFAKMLFIPYDNAIPTNARSVCAHRASRRHQHRRRQERGLVPHRAR